jgi:hypothetical protein
MSGRNGVSYKIPMVIWSDCLTAVKRENLSTVFMQNNFLPDSHHQGCQMACFQTKNSSLGKFWRDLQWKILVYFMYGNLAYFTAIWYGILWPFGLFYGHLV